MEEALEQLSHATIRDYTSKDVFVKVEALLVDHKPNWAPRVIYKGTDLYNAISGPIFNELMSRLSSSYDNMQGPHKFRVAYKRQPTDYTPFIERGTGDYVESDFSSNDMMQCSDVMVLEMALMRRLGAPEWFIRLHAESNKFTVKSSVHGVKAVLQNMLPTGATDTTFRNTFWNSCILYAFIRRVGVTTCRAILLGDDMLARMSGLKRYAVATYESIARDAQMKATVFRRTHLVDCTFLSRVFVPCRVEGSHLTVPLLGKALGRFNMRANRNSAVTNHAYMAGKSVGYAYEFRHYPPIRDLFMLRFAHEWAFVRTEKRRDFPLELSWNARSAGVTLANIKDKIIVSRVASEDDFFEFCYHRYRLTSREVEDLFSDVVLNTDAVDVDDHVVRVLSADFL